MARNFMDDGDIERAAISRRKSDKEEWDRKKSENNQNKWSVHTYDWLEYRYDFNMTIDQFNDAVNHLVGFLWDNVAENEKKNYDKYGVGYLLIDNEGFAHRYWIYPDGYNFPVIPSKYNVD